MVSHSWLILAFKATKPGWLVAWTFAPPNAPYGIIQRIQMWGTRRDWVVWALCLGLGIVLLEYIVDLRVCSPQPW